MISVVRKLLNYKKKGNTIRCDLYPSLEEEMEESGSMTFHLQRNYSYRGKLNGMLNEEITNKV
jgi:hypothetical protein